NLKDANNNTLATFNYSFVTASQPVVVGHVPATDAQYALPEAPISISFSKPIDTTTVTAASFILVKVGEGANLLDNTNVTWSEDFMTVTASPAAKLDYDTEYRVTLTTSVTDNDALLKNALIAYTYDFKTVKQTGIKSVAPVQNAVNVKIGTADTNIVLTLEKEQVGSAPKLAIKKLLGDGVFTYVDVAETAFTTHADGTSVYTYTLPAALPNNSVMQVTFSNLLDDNGYLIDYGFDNELSGDNTRGNFIYTFNTATQPVVITATPTSDIGETGQVDVTEPIVITFSKKMDTTDTNTFVTVTEEVADTGVVADFTANCDYVWSGGNTVLTITPKPVADQTYKGVFKYSSEYVVTLAAGLKDDSALGGNAIDQRTDIDLSNTNVQTNTFTFKTKSSEAPELSPLKVVRDRRVLTTSFTAVVNDNGAPINTAAEKVGVIVQTNAVTPTSVPANQLVKATIGENGYITCVLDPDADVNLIMDDNTVYYLYPYVETTYGNDTSVTFFAGDPVTVVLHPFNLEDNASDLAKTTATIALDNPFIIETAADLTALADTAVTAYWTSNNLKYLQIANIAADDTSISTDANKFAAQYNGGGFTISGGTVPMFAYLNTGAVVENVLLTGVNITTGETVGGIVAEMTAGTLKNCEVAGTAITGSATAGGIAGSVTAGTISGNAVSCPVTAPTAGGIAGSVTAGAISGNTNNAEITATTTGGCITAVGGTMTDNVCLKHDHKAQVTAGGVVNENTDQTYLLGALITAPTVSGTVHAGTTDLAPISGATDVSTSTQLIFTFNKPMDQILTQNAFSLKDASDNAVTCEFSWATKDDDSASVLTVTPKTSGNQSVALLPNTQYTATFAAGGVDIFGQTIGGTKSWNFTTALDVNIAKVVVKSGATVIDDTTTDTTTSDRKDVANVPVNSIIEIYFTDALNAAQEAIVESTDNVKLAADDLNTADFEAVDTAIAAPVLDGTKKILTVTPSANLPYASKLVLSLANLKDANNNTLATYNYSFVTASQPVVVGHSPAKDSAKALTGGAITIAFSKPMDKALVQTAISVSGGVTLGDWVWNSDNTTLSATPTARLAYNTTYAVTVAITAKDTDTLYQNPLKDEYTWSFTTGEDSGIDNLKIQAPATKGGVDYADFADIFNVPVDSRLLVTFADEFNETQYQAGTRPAFALDKAPTTLTPSLDTTGAKDIVSLLPTSSLTYDTEYTLTVSELYDANGFALDSITYSFKTASQPGILEITPAQASVNVKNTDPIVITFSKPMDITSTEAALTLTRQAFPAETATSLSKGVVGADNYQTSWSADNTVLTIRPNNDASEPYWLYNSLYTLGLANTAADATTYKNQINDAWTGYAFTTVGRTQIDVDAVSGAKKVALAGAVEDTEDLPVAYLKDSGLTITFKEPQTPAQRTAVEAAVSIKGGSAYTINSKAWNAGFTELTVTIAEDCAYNEDITLSVGALTDDRGVAANAETFTFHTASRPVVVSVSPAVGSTVLPGNSIMVTFSKSMDKASVVANTNIKLQKHDGADYVDLAGGLTFFADNKSWSENDTILNASPSSRLEYGGKYKVIVTSTVTDAAAAKNRMGADYSWEFSVHDRTGIEAVSPIENAVAVRKDAEIAITMVKAPADVTVGNGPQIAFETLIGSAYTAAATDLTWSQDAPDSGLVGRINPVDFPNNTLIKATLSNLKDDSGYLLDYGLGAGVFEYTFNTATMPTVVHRSPLKTPDTTPVAITEPIVIVFDKPMDEDTLTFENITVTEISYGGNTPRTLDADDFTYSYSASADSSYALTITPKAAGSDFAVDGQFPYNSRYTVSFINANVKDAAVLGNNPLNGAYDWSFTTVSEAAPLFGNFTISRDRTTLTADYVVSSESGPDITQYGYAISHDNATWVPLYTDMASAEVNGVTIVTSAISEVDGQVTMSFSGFTNNTTYYIKP
ncbi:MAG: Ig-like domain-containing protein, partial [Pusillimonas sp.]